MCGDAANDCLAFKSADVQVSLEPSIKLGFASLTPTVDSVRQLLRYFVLTNDCHRSINKCVILACVCVCV